MGAPRGCLTGLGKAGDWQQQLEWGKRTAGTVARTRGLTLGCWLQLIQGRNGVVGGWLEEEGPMSPLPLQGVVQPGFLQEFLKDCSFGRTSFGGNQQMHLALVRDRPKGEAKNISGRAATQRERPAGNLIPMVGALVVTVTSFCTSPLGSPRQQSLRWTPGRGTSSQLGAAWTEEGEFQGTTALDQPIVTAAGPLREVE